MEYVEGEPLSGMLRRRPLDNEALIRIRRGLEVDPLSLPVNHMAGLVLSLAGRTDEAIAQFRRTLEMEPRYSTSRSSLAQMYEKKGMHEEAFAELQRVKERGARGLRY